MAMLDDAIAMQTMQYPGGPYPRQTLVLPSANPAVAAGPPAPRASFTDQSSRINPGFIAALQQALGRSSGASTANVLAALTPFLAAYGLRRAGSFNPPQGNFAPFAPEEETIPAGTAGVGATTFLGGPGRVTGPIGGWSRVLPTPGQE